MLTVIRRFHDGMQARIWTDHRECSDLFGVSRACGKDSWSHHCCSTLCFCVAVKRFIADADVKGMVCTNKVRGKKAAGKKLERPEKGRDIPQEAMEGPKPIWGMLYADDADIVSRSRNSLAKMKTVIVAVCASFGLTFSEAKTETMCLMTKGMDRVTFVTEAAGQVCKQSAKFVYLGATMCENADLTVDVNRRMLLANLRLRRYSPVTIRAVHGTVAAQSTDAQSRGHGNHVVRV